MNESDIAREAPPLIRGLAMVNHLVVFKQLYGSAVLDEFRATLSDRHRLLFDGGFTPSQWYDENIEVALCGFVVQRYGKEAGFRMGVAVGCHVVGKVHRFLARIVGPYRLLTKTAAIWSYWRSTGHSEVEHFEEGEARVTILDHTPMTDQDHLLTYCGAAGYIVAISGARNVRIGANVESDRRVVIRVVWGEKHPDSDGMYSIDDALRAL